MVAQVENSGPALGQQALLEKIDGTGRTGGMTYALQTSRGVDLSRMLLSNAEEDMLEKALIKLKYQNPIRRTLARFDDVLEDGVDYSLFYPSQDSNLFQATSWVTQYVALGLNDPNHPEQAYMLNELLAIVVKGAFNYVQRELSEPVPKVSSDMEALTLGYAKGVGAAKCDVVNERRFAPYDTEMSKKLFQSIDSALDNHKVFGRSDMSRVRLRMAYEIGQKFGKDLKKLTRAEKREILKDPVKLQVYANVMLKDLGIKVALPEAYHAGEVHKLREENEALQAQISSAGKTGDLKDAKAAGASHTLAR